MGGAYDARCAVEGLGSATFYAGNRAETDERAYLLAEPDAH